jgi:hypothetical protein
MPGPSRDTAVTSQDSGAGDEGTNAEKSAVWLGCSGSCSDQEASRRAAGRMRNPCKGPGAQPGLERK